MFGLALALSLQTALDRQGEVRYQRDIAEADASEMTRSSFTRPVSTVDDRPVQIVTIAAVAGSVLDWPGLDHAFEPGTTLASPSVLGLDQPQRAGLVGAPEPGLLHPDLESFPGEFVVVRFADPAEELRDATRLAPGFAVSRSAVEDPASPVLLLLVAS